MGDRLKRARMDRGLSLEKAGRELGADASTLKGWEDGRFGVRRRHRGKVVAFLDYDPFPPERRWGEEIRKKRLALGLTVKALAKVLGVNQETVAAWERGAEPMRHRARVEAFLDGGTAGEETRASDS